MRSDCFIKSMTSAPIFEKNNPEQFTPRILAIFDKLKKNGLDPIDEVRKAYERVDSQVRLRQRCPINEERVLKKGNYRKVGSFTWWVYIRVQMRKILSVLTEQKLDLLIKVD